MLKTHSVMGKVGKYRRDLEQLSLEDGLHYCIDALSIKFMAMRTWKNNEDDPNIRIYKFEDIADDPLDVFKNLFDFCNIHIPESHLQSVLSDYTKEKLRAKDLEKRKDQTDSHYRVKGSNFREAFTKKHMEHFREVTGNLSEFLGYDPE
jgi:hypothetical protein